MGDEHYKRGPIPRIVKSTGSLHSLFPGSTPHTFFYTMQPFALLASAAVLAGAALAESDAGVSKGTTTFVYTEFYSYTVSGDFTTHVTIPSDAVGAEFYYSLNNETFTLTTAADITMTNCPCVVTSQSLATSEYTDVKYASNYVWETINGTVSQVSALPSSKGASVSAGGSKDTTTTGKDSSSSGKASLSSAGASGSSSASKAGANALGMGSLYAGAMGVVLSYVALL